MYERTNESNMALCKGGACGAMSQKWRYVFLPLYIAPLIIVIIIITIIMALCNFFSKNKRICGAMYFWKH